MNRKLSYIVLLLTSIAYSQNIIIDDQLTPNYLVMDVLFNGAACANVSNVSITGGNFGTSEQSFGYFDGNGSVFPYAEGVVLTTGKAIHAAGPNDFISSDGDTSWGPDTNVGGTSDLEDVTGVSGTLNATVLEFDFIPDSTLINFDFIFASEEYQENESTTCVYSDEFAFLIKPVNFGSYQNIALVPGTSTRISILTVHPTIAPGGQVACIGENEEFFDRFNDTTAPINYNGQTVSMSAQANVSIGVTYHLKIIIADDNNPFYDSAVFFKAGGFNFSGLNLGQDMLIQNGTALCPGKSTILDAGTGTQFVWSKDGVPYDGIILPLVTGQFLTVTESGVYDVVVGNTQCATSDNIRIEYDVLPPVRQTTLLQCVFNNATNAVYNLFDTTTDLIGDDPNLSITGFYLSPNDAEDFPTTTAIPNPQSFANITANQEIFARVSNLSGCTSISKITLLIGNYPVVTEDEEVLYCLNTFPNKIELDSGLVSANPSEFSFLWSTSEISQTIEVNQIGDYTVTITRNLDNCSVTRTVSVVASNIATFDGVLVTDMDNKDRISIIIQTLGEGDYEYSLESIDGPYQDANTFEYLTYGLHTVYIRDKNGCLPVTIADFVLLDHPKFLTPNNDGRYDTWNINNINSMAAEFNTISNISIFDRYGKIMATIVPNGLGWDGKYKGEFAPADDYWFRIELINFKGESIIKKGHFSLIR